MITRSVGARRTTRRTGGTRSGPPPDRPPVPSPPRWRNWLLVAGVIITLALFLLPFGSSGGNAQELSYTQLKSDLTANQVRSITIGPDGGISGTLTSGTAFTSSYPIGIDDPQFAQLLDAPNVQVDTQPAQYPIGPILVLTDHRAALDRLTELLLERETIDGADVDVILGQIPEPRPTTNGQRAALS